MIDRSFRFVRSEVTDSISFNLDDIVWISRSKKFKWLPELPTRLKISHTLFRTPQRDYANT